MAPNGIVTITDDLDTVDLATTDIDKSQSVREYALKSPNRKGDSVQTFGSEGFILKVKGVWATGAGVTDYRSIVQFWHDNNILVYYNDGDTVGWYSIYKFQNYLVPGHPATETIIEFDMELHESIATPEDITLTGDITDMVSEGNFTTWTKLFEVTIDSWAPNLATIDEPGTLFYARGTNNTACYNISGVQQFNSSIDNPNSGVGLGVHPVIWQSIQGIYEMFLDTATDKRPTIYKNGSLLFQAPLGSLGFFPTDSAISPTGKYLAFVGFVGGFGKLAVYQGS